MSDLPADDLDRLNIRELLTRIDRQREEALKLAAEQHKLAAETSKLSAEAAKLTRERSWFPVQVGIAFMAAGGALVAGTVALMRLMGG